MVGVNVGVAAPRRPSSRSRAGRTRSSATCTRTGRDAVEFFTRKKTVTTRFFSAGETGPFFVEIGEKR